MREYSCCRKESAAGVFAFSGLVAENVENWGLTKVHLNFYNRLKQLDDTNS